MGDRMNEAIQTMNSADTIKEQTKLYGLIAENASTNRLFLMLNKEIKSNGADAMMIPMNIRSDDFYFTVSNMKKSQLNGAYIASEYQQDILEMLDEYDEFVQVYGKCDFVVRKGVKLYGTYIEKNGHIVAEALIKTIFDEYIKE